MPRALAFNSVKYISCIIAVHAWHLRAVVAADRNQARLETCLSRAWSPSGLDPVRVQAGCWTGQVETHWSRQVGALRHICVSEPSGSSDVLCYSLPQATVSKQAHTSNYTYVHSKGFPMGPCYDPFDSGGVYSMGPFLVYGV